MPSFLVCKISDRTSTKNFCIVLRDSVKAGRCMGGWAKALHGLRRSTRPLPLIYCDADNNSASWNNVEYRHSISALGNWLGRLPARRADWRRASTSRSRQPFVIAGLLTAVVQLLCGRSIDPSSRPRRIDKVKLKIATAINHLYHFPTCALIFLDRSFRRAGCMVNDTAG